MELKLQKCQLSIWIIQYLALMIRLHMQSLELMTVTVQKLCCAHARMYVVRVVLNLSVHANYLEHVINRTALANAFWCTLG